MYKIEKIKTHYYSINSPDILLVEVKKELKIYKKIANHALNSFYRLNASSADCYAFTLIKNGKDWEGGWDWMKNIVDVYATHIMRLNDKKVFKIID